MVCAVLNDSASDPYRHESNGKKKMATYFNPDTLQLVMVLLLVNLMQKLVVAQVIVEFHN
jgi:hypothetical protein